MIRLHDISLQRGSKILLTNATTTIHDGQKVAITGANGCGKSSLFAVFNQQLTVDSGEFTITPNLRIAHMAQEVTALDKAAIEYVIDGDQHLRSVQHQLTVAEQQHNNNLIAHLHSELEKIDGYTAHHRAAQLLHGLGFSTQQEQLPVTNFSGGWRIRLNLAQALMKPSDLLLLDEPTNHLDLDAILWLEQWLKSYRGTLIIISHDRDFLDNVVNQIIHIERQTLNTYRGNYSQFEVLRSEQLAHQQSLFEKQQTQRAHIESFIARFRAKATKAKQVQSRIKALERLEKIAPAHADSPFTFTFPASEKMSDPLLQLHDCALGYADQAILQNVKLNIHPGDTIGLLGPNGAGKSTLLKSLAGMLSIPSGERICGEHLKIGYFAQHQLEYLDNNASPALHLQRLSPNASEQSIRNFLGSFDFRGDLAFDPITHFSGGEKARLALAIIAWQKPNLLLLDEPTNHLDLEMRQALTVALQAFAGALVVVSHDRHLLRNCVDQLLLVANNQVKEYDGDLDDYAQWLSQEKQPTSQQLESSGTSQTTQASQSKKDQRRKKAEIRQQLRPLTSKIKKQEQALEQLLTKLDAITIQLNDNDIYSDNKKEQLKQLLAEQHAIKKQQEETEEQLLINMAELETLEETLNDTLADE
ncbi:ATP-binding cassette domain-containing protein [Zooshikella ganghwensis]|uniref:Probable ATP-binding protein YheS n=1 Tax=Zooshikella ganghwensis TaxID=202772 RepID=A0A4P9VIY2_9GAMM|nr:ATP-binding cassette domain-containing protein [Zooshikella ganghwensis]RDH42324.1 ATP-binding cassette domain-containing protein [Zooshikella ganghwensis]